MIFAGLLNTSSNADLYSELKSSAIKITEVDTSSWQTLEDGKVCSLIADTSGEITIRIKYDRLTKLPTVDVKCSVDDHLIKQSIQHKAAKLMFDGSFAKNRHKSNIIHIISPLAPLNDISRSGSLSPRVNTCKSHESVKNIDFNDLTVSGMLNSSLRWPGHSKAVVDYDDKCRRRLYGIDKENIGHSNIGIDMMHGSLNDIKTHRPKVFQTSSPRPRWHHREPFVIHPMTFKPRESKFVRIQDCNMFGDSMSDK